MMRDLSGPGQTRAMRDLLQSLFASELIRPSRPLWLFFAWTTDLEILDNSARQFASLCPDWPAMPIRLSTVLDALLSRGGAINILLREHAHNQAFLSRLRTLRNRHGAVIKFHVVEAFHEKGMLGDGYVLDGSMNLTVSGLTVNDEHIVLRCDKSTVAQRRLDLQNRWGSRLE